MNDNFKAWIKDEIIRGGVDAVNEINKIVFDSSPCNINPVGFVKWVHIDNVEANDYNPNTVASTELRLLSVSISHDGYTQPVVTIFDKDKNKYIIIDGFHRYFVMKSNKKIMELNKGLLPVVVLNKDINDRIASTVRHNRARGKHSVNGMSQLIFKMVANGWDDVRICNELGLEPDELLRLKHISGVAKLFEDKTFGKAWEESYQVKERLKNEVKK